MKQIFISKGVMHFKKEQGLRWVDIRDRMGYECVTSASNLISVKGSRTKLIEQLAECFQVTPSEFVKQCEVTKEKDQ